MGCWKRQFGRQFLFVPNRCTQDQSVGVRSRLQRISKVKKILIIGCSNGLGIQHAFRQVFQKTQSQSSSLKINADKNKFPDEILKDNYCEYTNLSMAGAGNTYIRQRLFEHLEDQTPDYVYLQFSGLVRRDICIEAEAFDLFLNDTDDSTFYKITNKKIHLVGGNFKPFTSLKWFNKFFALSYSTENFNTNNTNSLAEIFCCINLLEKLGIKHNWNFYYDPCNAPTQLTKEEGLIDELPKYFNITNMLPSPLNFAVAKGTYSGDGCHFEYQDFVEFLETHKDIINLN